LFKLLCAFLWAIEGLLLLGSLGSSRHRSFWICPAKPARGANATIGITDITITIPSSVSTRARCWGGPRALLRPRLCVPEPMRNDHRVHTPIRVTKMGKPLPKGPTAPAYDSGKKRVTVIFSKNHLLGPLHL